MNRVLILGFVLWRLLPSLCLAAELAKIPEATVAMCQGPVKVDGVLDEPCWQKAGPLTGFHVLGLEEIARDTTVRLAHDSAWLYVAVACEHPAPQALKPGNFDHDGAVHTDESVEVFIDPGTDGRCYFHFKLNCANVKAEQRAGRDGWRDPKWDSPWRSATRIHETRWNAEMAIPLYVLASHGDLKKTRMNVTRNKVVPEIDRQGVIVSEKRQLTTWSPMVKTFHEPERFGALSGLDVARLEVPFLAGFENAKITAYYMADGKYSYDVLLDVRGHNDKSGRVTLTVLDQPVAGKERRLSREVEVKGMKSLPVRMPVAMDSPSQRKVTVAMIEAETGTTLRLARIAETAARNLMSAYLDRTYYTTEEQALAVCSLGLPDEALRATQFVVTDEKGNVLGETREVSRETQVPMTIKALDVGVHAVNVHWQQKDGRPIFSQNLTLIKRPPKPGLEWKIDKVNKVILRDGKPFFPCGLIMAGITDRDEADIKRVADAGFNTIAHWCLKQPVEGAAAYLEVARKHGLMVLARKEGFAKGGVEGQTLEQFLSGEALERAIAATRGASQTHLKGALVTLEDFRRLSRAARSKIFADAYHLSLDRMLEAIRLSKDFDNLIGFNTFDEPILEFFDQHEQGRDLYRRTNEVDGYHPTFLLYSSYISEGEEATDWCDALGTDPYWTPAWPRDRNTPNFVSKITWMTKKRSDRVQKATWIVPVAELWSGMHKRVLVADEQYCQTYLALIHGAKALIYFRYPVMHQTSWDALTRMALELKALGPIAVTPDVPQQIAYSPGKFDPDNEQYPDVPVSLRQNPSGGYVLLAANSRPYAVDVTYTLSCLKARGEMGRLFGAEKYAVRERQFSDRLERYATRAYVIAQPDNAHTPVQVAVATKAEQAAGPAEVEIPRSGRPGKKNVAPNPSFEEASLPGWPDYHRPWYSEPLMGNPDAGCGLDAKDPYHGRFCFRLTKNQRGYNGFYFYCAPQHDRPAKYVLSVYLKANREGMKVVLGGAGWDWKTVTPTTAWQRHHVSGVVPPRMGQGNIFQVRTSDNGTIWADALQLEPGEEPSAFEP